MGLISLLQPSNPKPPNCRDTEQLYSDTYRSPAPTLTEPQNFTYSLDSLNS
jgi:hypothetical protein